MTAQVNDPLNAFAYPSTPTTSVPAKPDDTNSSNVVNSAPAVLDPSTVANDRGNQISGPAPLPVDPAVLESVTPVAAPDMPVQEMNLNSSSQPDTTKDVQLEVSNNAPTPQQMTEEPKENHEDESPLQALARKLAKLREELVEEVPEEDSNNDKIGEVSSAAAPAVENVQTETLPPMMSETTAIQPLATPSVVDNVVSTQTDSQSPVVPMPEISPTPSATPMTSTLDQLYPDMVDKKEEVPSVADTPVNPVSVAPVESVNTMSPSVVDENDDTQVSPQVVEDAAKGSKYPLSINKIMDIAIEKNASDIHVSVGYPVMIRIDGTLIAVNDHVVSETNAEELIMPVLSEQKKELLEVNREVDLAYSPLHNNQARFRINAYYSKGNLTAAFRLIPSRIRTIEELMLPPIYNQIVKLGQGLVLVTGPTGHGKSTTLAAMLQAINSSRAVHMLTIEDPIEYIFSPSKAVVDQREMHDDTHSWTVALKSALRQDPDVILVGEMRDYETIAATITLAETGHLVFATLHTNSAAQTVDRIIDVFPENQQAQIRTQLANILEAVIAQRLIPIDGGGRRAVSEIMIGTPAVRNLIREGKTHQLDNVIRTSADVGMFSLEQSLVKLVREGLITMDKAQEYAVHPEEVVRLLKS